MILLDQIRGLSDSKWSGIFGSVSKCIGLDLHSTPGLLKVHQALAKDSGATVSELCKVAVSVSNGFTIWFSSESGKIWARNSSGTWTLAHTTTPAAGGAACLGAMEYDSFLYWATESRLHRIAISNVDGDWTGNAVENWATFDVTDSEWHPMSVTDLTLFIGDGNQMASVNSSGTFDSNVLDINEPLRIKTMIPYGLDLLIGTFTASTVNKAELIVWDTISPSWNTSDPIEEVGINAFIRDDNFVYAQAGRAGNIYFYNGEQLVPFKRIPGDFSNVKYGEVYPNSVGNFKGVPIFGFSNSTEAGNSTGNPAEQGVYSFGSYSRDYPKIMDLSWVISQDTTSGVETGAIIVQDFDLMVAWTDGTNHGVDKIDYSNKYTGAHFETMLLFQDERDTMKTIKEMHAFYENMPSGTSVTFAYQKNHSGSYTSETSVKDSLQNKIYAESGLEEVGAVQIKVSFTVSSNNAPTLEIPLGVEKD